jgi:hypothetical protein
MVARIAREKIDWTGKFYGINYKIKVNQDLNKNFPLG